MAEPKSISLTATLDVQAASDAGEATLQDYQGKYVLLNFWATWCAPCRKEMPMLSELQTEFGGETFEVVTLATGRNSPAGIVKFFKETGIDNLPRHQDPKQSVAREMAVFGLPITVIITLVASLIVALIFNPVLCARMINLRRNCHDIEP